MSRWHSYLNSAKEILLLYKGEEPFASFLKKHFKRHKKFGATDRKLVSHLCYCYFRTGKGLPGLPVEERILTGLFLVSEEPNKLLEELQPGWNQNAGLSLQEKIALIDQPDLINTIFPWITGLSNDIDQEEFSLSHLRQPYLFLRLRPGYETAVQQKLKSAGIHFDMVSSTSIALQNSSKIDNIIELDKEAVVQDHSSQRVGNFLQNIHLQDTNLKHTVWDCCAASGGKSIMAKDILGDIDLAVSDIRESILVNLEKRFRAAGIINYRSTVLDLGEKNVQNSPDIHRELNSQFSIIIADVPCTGSGTWSRNPEHLFYFEPGKIGEYADLQKKILTNCIPHLGPGGYMLYITCSVFKKENEEAVDFLTEKFKLQLVKMQLLKGYDKKADTLFAALLKSPL